MGTAVEEDLAPAPGAAITPPVAASSDDEDLAFLKPGFRRPKVAPADEELAPAPGAEIAPPVAGPEDRIGRANRAFQQNSDALQRMRTGAPDPNAPPLPQTSTAEAVGRGALQGASLGIGDEFAALADAAISKIPGVRRGAEYLADKAGGRGASLDYTNPDITYDERRDAYRRLNEAAREQHGKAYLAGEIGGGLATAAIPGTAVAKGAGALEVGVQGALLGGIAGAGESTSANAAGVLSDAAKSAALGGLGGAALHTVGTKVVAPLVQKGIEKLSGKAAALVDRQATAQLAKDAPRSLTGPMTQDANLSAAINEPIQITPKKSVTLAEMAGRPAQEVRPVVQAQQERVGEQIGKLLDKAGDARLGDLAKHYDAEIAQYAKTPGNAKAISALEGARDEALEHWGPTEQAIETQKGKIGNAIDKVYDKSDAKAGGVTLGDLVAHRDADIARLAKTPGNQAAIRALEDSKQDIIHAWGTRPMFDPKAIVKGGTVEGMEAGKAIPFLEKLKAANPGQAKALDAEITRVRDAATAEGFDPTVQVPAKDVRAYATKLQNEGATSVQDPKLAAQARQFLGSTTRDFVNGHVENTLGPGDRKALQGLNQRMSNLYRWPDVVAGKEADPAVRDAVLREFDQKVAPRDLDAYASKLEERGTQRIDKLNPGEASLAKENLGKVTRDFANKHAAKNLQPDDLSEFGRLNDRRNSLKNIDKVLERRAGGEQKAKMGLAERGAHLTTGLLGAHEIMGAIPKAVAGDIPGAAIDVAKGVGVTALPYVVKNAGAIGRASVRGSSRALDFLSDVVAKAEAGNPWAKRQVALLRQTPAGAARLASALARSRGVPSAQIPSEAASGPAPEGTGPAMAER